MSENKDVVQMHGCIVRAKILNVLAVYVPNGELVGCTVTSLAATVCRMNINFWPPVIPTLQMRLSRLIKDGSPGMKKSWLMSNKTDKTAPNGLQRLL